MDNLRVFLKGFDFCCDLDEEDLQNYIRRYDRDVDKRLDYSDFVSALGPYCQYNQKADMENKETRNERDSMMKDGLMTYDEDLAQNS